RRIVPALFGAGAAVILSAAACTPTAKGPPPGATATATQALTAPLLPCLDSRGCPDLILSQTLMALHLVLDSRQVSAQSCAAIEGEAQPGNRRLLRFNSASINAGEGALIVGMPSSHPELYDFVTCHGHPHFKSYAAYRLWTRSGYVTW